MSLIHRVGWVWALEKNVTRFYVTNWGGRVGLRPNSDNVTNFTLFFIEGFPYKRYALVFIFASK